MSSQLRTGMICACLLLTLGCSASVERAGYNAPSVRPVLPCLVAIRYRLRPAADEVEVLGRVEVYDSGISTECHEDHVLRLLEVDACTLGADVIDIVEEHQPDFRSTCYRAKAELLRFKDRRVAEEIVSDPRYGAWAVLQRTEASSRRTRNVALGALLGMMIGTSVAP